MCPCGNFSPYLIKFHDFADNSQEGMKHQMRGATQAQQVMTLGVTSMGEQLIVLESGQDIAHSRSQGGPKLCWPVLPF
jgi:hypothetical protein